MTKERISKRTSTGGGLVASLLGAVAITLTACGQNYDGPKKEVFGYQIPNSFYGRLLAECDAQKGYRRELDQKERSYLTRLNVEEFLKSSDIDDDKVLSPEEIKFGLK